MKRLHLSSQFNSLFILYISTAKPFSLLVTGYIEVKINKHEIWKALTQRTLICLKYIKGIFSPHAVRHSCFLIPPRVFLQKKSEIVREKFFSSSENAVWSMLLKYQEIDVKIQTFTDEN